MPMRARTLVELVNLKCLYLYRSHMIDRFERLLRNARRAVSRNEWSIRRLGLTVFDGAHVEPGLVLVNVEALSVNSLEHAFERGHLPFLNRLMRIEGYRVWRLSARQRAAADVERSLLEGSSNGDAGKNDEARLLSGGSQYCGHWAAASETHFMQGQLHMPEMLKSARPLIRAGMVVGHAWLALRVLLSLVVETVAQVLSTTRESRLSRSNSRVWARVKRGTLLRDLCAVGTAVDVTRGLPVVHTTLIGYRDAQEDFARDTLACRMALRGIDSSIKRMWLAARRSPRRDYEVWIYGLPSDADPTGAVASWCGNGAAPRDRAQGFVLAPADAPLAEHVPLEIQDVRQAALHVLGRAPLARDARPAHVRQRQTVRIMTYNVHSCIGMDGKLSPARIARVIAQCDPDIVALQELDVGRLRTQAVDQAHAIAQELKMEFHFHPAMTLEEEQYGDAVLSRFPMRLVKAGPLPTLNGRAHLEPRGALWTLLDVDGAHLHLINTHLGLVAEERMRQAEALTGPDWLEHPQLQGPTVLCGDFNALPGSKVCRCILRRLADAQLVLNGHRPKHTFFTRYPIGRIDHVFVSPDLEVVAVEVPRNDMIRRASDHLPLVVEVKRR